ncbi:TetR family transcriptional regulator C-terminal domain-containing protein [Luedemannella flava]|uniref:TetR family transcriptional regulator C-terminal domain-containing protein n=1 Tax=Luedemannella flava TaxID=349316 RepID=A0ABP4Z0P4_9ACTN
MLKDPDAPNNPRAHLADRRRAELLRAARKVVVERGIASTRVADIAKETRVSGGLIHYHFATKDDLMVAMLRATSDIERAQLDEIVGSPGTALHRLDRVIRQYIPGEGTDQSWMLWIEAWAAGLRTPALRVILEELELAWIHAVERVIREGVEQGEFTCVDPAAAAERVDAMLDGLIVRLTLHPDAVTHARVLEHVRVATAREIGLDPADLANA